MLCGLSLLLGTLLIYKNICEPLQRMIYKNLSTVSSVNACTYVHIIAQPLLSARSLSFEGIYYLFIYLFIHKCSNPSTAGCGSWESVV